MEAYQKADKLADCVSVAVELPSGHFEGPIKRVHLSWRLPGEHSKDNWRQIRINRLVSNTTEKIMKDQEVDSSATK